MTTGALAVVLLLNGVQIDLPGPAVIVGGTCMVPLRAVCERVGATVTSAGSGGIAIQTTRGTHRLPPASQSNEDAAAGFVLIDGAAFGPARRLASLLDGTMYWHPESRTVDLHLPWCGSAVNTAPEAVTRAPLQWRGVTVAMNGRTMGRLGAPHDPGVAGRPPSQQSFVLSGAGSIYCESQEYREQAPPPPALSQRASGIGIEGPVTLDAQARPYVKPQVLGRRSNCRPVTWAGQKSVTGGSTLALHIHGGMRASRLDASEPPRLIARRGSAGAESRLGQSLVREGEWRSLGGNSEGLTTVLVTVPVCDGRSDRGPLCVLIDAGAGGSLLSAPVTLVPDL